MTQSNFNLQNQSRTSFRASVNTALQALATQSSGNTAPTTTYAGMLWEDTSSTPSILKKRNQSNNAWVTIGIIGDPSKMVFYAGDTAKLAINQYGVGVKTEATTEYSLAVAGKINAEGLYVNGESVGAAGNNSITYAKIQKAVANSVLCRAEGTTGNIGELQLTTSSLFGRGATGNLTAITLGSGLSMTGNVISSNGGSLINIVKITASGQYTPSSSAVKNIVVECVGGGGGGYGYAGSAAGTGGTTSFGTFCSASGGTGGAYYLSGGAGGVGTIGDLTGPGERGGAGHIEGNGYGAATGEGGNSFYGRGAGITIVDGSRHSGIAGSLYGGGGGGAYSRNANGTLAGSGGGGGGYALAKLSVESIGLSVSVTIGAGGYGGNSSSGDAVNGGRGADGVCVVWEYS